MGYICFGYCASTFAFRPNLESTASRPSSAASRSSSASALGDETLEVLKGQIGFLILGTGPSHYTELRELLLAG